MPQPGKPSARAGMWARTLRLARRLAWLVPTLATPAAAHAQALLDPASVPYLTAPGRAVYADYLLANLPRALAIASNGHLGWARGKTIEQARADAVELCRSKGGEDCTVYAENLDIVWPGRETRVSPPPGPLVSTFNYAFVPDERFFWRGPEQAAGVYVWSGGNAGPANDLRGQQPQAYVRAFNNAGFDVVRFDRAPLVDLPVRAAGWLRDELGALRRSGYRRVVVGGQSRGAWTSLQMLDTAGLADAVIAISPAAHGSAGSTNLLAQDDDLRQLVAAAEPSQTRVAVVQFEGDPFISDPDVRARLLQGLAGKTGGLLLIDRPAGFGGHYGGDAAAFAPLFANCLRDFSRGQAGGSGAVPEACATADR